jgi:hypothetical protein
LTLQEAADHLGGPTCLKRVVFCLYDATSYQVFASAFAVS